MTAMQAKAQAKVAYDVAVTEELVRKPDSVLAMTCFNQAASVSAKNGGAIFSGDFVPELAPIIETPLQNFYTQFNGSAGQVGGSVDYSNAATKVNDTSTFNCKAMQDLWKQTEDEGVNTKVPYMDDAALRTGAAPAAAGTDMKANLAASSGVFSALDAAITAIPKAGDPGFNVPDFSASISSCDVLLKAGIVTACP